MPDQAPHFGSISGTPWSCTAEQMNEGFTPTHSAMLTFDSDGTIKQLNNQDDLHWSLGGTTQWVRSGTNISWDPQTDYLFSGTINGENTNIAGRWRNSASQESGPFTCKR
jgi:hypothetical protein